LYRNGLRKIRIAPRHVALIGAIALVAISIVAVADHRSKQHRIQRASVASWWCTHRGVRCDEETTDAIGDRWHRRERIYEGTVAVILITGVVSVALATRRRRTSEN
jgi:hypothetical protein